MNKESVVLQKMLYQIESVRFTQLCCSLLLHPKIPLMQQKQQLMQAFSSSKIAIGKGKNSMGEAAVRKALESSAKYVWVYESRRTYINVCFGLNGGVKLELMAAAEFD